MNRTVIKKRIGRRIKQARETIGLTQVQLAERMGVKQPTIVGYETGYRTPNAADLPRLAEILQVLILFFFQEEDDQSTEYPT